MHLEILLQYWSPNDTASEEMHVLRSQTILLKMELEIRTIHGNEEMDINLFQVEGAVIWSWKSHDLILENNY